MTRQGMRSLGLVLALALGSVTLHAQRGGSGTDVGDRFRTCTCTGAGVHCVFGNAGPCSIECYGSGCVCRGAWCLFGFPRPSRCKCTTGQVPQV